MWIFGARVGNLNENICSLGLEGKVGESATAARASEFGVV